MSTSRILRVVSGPDTGRVFPITHLPMLVGAEPVCDVQLIGDDISSKHAVLEEADGCLLLRDLESETGTFVNGSPIRAELLNPGDTLAFGTTSVQLWVHGDIVEELTLEDLDGSTIIDDVPSGAQFASAGQAQEIQAALSGAEVSALFRVPTEEIGINAPAHRAFRSLDAVYEINKVLGTTFDIETVLSRVLDIVLAAVDGDRGVALLMEGGPSGEVVQVARHHPGFTHHVEQASLSLSRTIAQHVLTTSEAVLTTDAASDERFRAGDSVLALNIRSAMCVPLTGRRDTLGIIHLDAGGRNVFTEESLRLLATIADIAGKVIENARLYQANLDAERLAAVGQTVAGTAHYMKNMLTGLMAGAELVDLGLDSEDVEAIRLGWTPIRRNLDILSDLVLNMLDYSRDRHPSFQAVHAAELLGDLETLVAHRAEGRNIELCTLVEGELPPLRADPVGIHRAALNLITNALDAFPDDQAGTVTLSAHATDDDMVLSVSDDGTGIPEDVLPNIFDIFCTTKGSKGTGFGLAVTRKIVEEHGGRLEVETEQGEGTTFRILLPR